MIIKSEMVIHPVRLRILGALALRQMTTKELARVLPDIPQATLYRQIKTLADHGLVIAAETKSVNGITESTYTASQKGAHFTREEFAAIPADEHLRYFGVFLGTQMIDAQRYFGSPNRDTTRQGMTYLRANLLLTDDEAQEFRVELLALIDKHTFGPGTGRRMQSVAISSIPEIPEEIL